KSETSFLPTRLESSPRARRPEEARPASQRKGPVRDGLDDAAVARALVPAGPRRSLPASRACSPLPHRSCLRANTALRAPDTSPASAVTPHPAEDAVRATRPSRPPPLRLRWFPATLERAVARGGFWLLRPSGRRCRTESWRAIRAGSSIRLC